MATTSINGFLLTRNWRDTAHGIELEFWFSTDLGPVQVLIPQLESVFFLEAQAVTAPVQALIKSGGRSEIRPLGLRNFALNPVVGVYSKSYRSARQLADRLQEAGVETFESDINPADRFLMERFIAGSAEIVGDVAPRNGYLSLSNPKLRRSSYLPNLKVASFDIETSMDRQEIYSIAIHATYGETVEKVVFMQGEGATSTNVIACHSQRALIDSFLQWLNERDPDVLIGWNVVGFDCDYLQKVSNRIGCKLRMGRNRTTVQWKNLRNTATKPTIYCPGRVILDGIELLRAAFYQFESFSLENVSHELLGEGKLITGNHRGDEITRLFNENKDDLAAYNLMDAELVSRIFQHSHLLEFALARTSMTGLNLDRMGGSVASFDNLYLPKLHRAGYIAPNASKDETASPGGWVLDSTPGIYEHVLVLDFKSLYPSIIRTFAIDPLGLAIGASDCTDESETIPGFLGASFIRDGHILPGLIEELWDLRDGAKSDKNGPLSQAVKIIMNSFYGVLGSPGCRFYDPRLASSITRRGHEILKQTKQRIESSGHHVIYGDTDSVFVWIHEACSNEEAIAAGRQLEHDLNDWWKLKVSDEFETDCHLELEFETHYQHFLMPTVRGSDKGSKKRYAGITTDGQLIFKGLENVRSDWTLLARKFQEELYRRIFAGEEYRTLIRDMAAEVRGGKYDDELVYRKRLRRNLEDYQQSTPPHVKAGRLYETRGLSRPRKGNSIEYVMTMAGPEPALMHESAIDYDHYIEKQLAPIADGILCFLGETFSSLVDSQFELFS